MLPVTPREHVHETMAADGRLEAVAHRHTTSHRHGHDAADEPHPAQSRPGRGGAADHHHGGRQSGHARHGGGAISHDDAIDHQESVVAQIGTDFTVPDDAPLPDPTVAPLARALPSETTTRAAQEPYVERLNHGPPGPHTASRPPPSATRI